MARIAQRFLAKALILWPPRRGKSLGDTSPYPLQEIMKAVTIDEGRIATRIKLSHLK
jgi:hypothetical protein